MSGWRMWAAWTTILLVVLLAATSAVAAQPAWDWAVSTPEAQGMSLAKLEAAWADLGRRGTTGLLVIRNDRIVFERYTPDYSRTKPHGTASMAKALVGGTCLMLAMDDGRIGPDDPASKFIPTWKDMAGRKDITIRHLATHTSGIEDAEEGDLPHAELTGWKGDFWKQPAPPRDPFTLARDVAPVLDVPGTKERYSNPGMAMLGYCVTVALQGGQDKDLRSLLRHRIMQPLGVPDNEWSVGYGKPIVVEGLPMVATWGGAAYSANATARVGRLMLRNGNWEGKQLVAAAVVKAATTFAGMPNYSGLGWWVNRGPDGSRKWPAAPADAFGGSGAGHQFLLVVPSQNLIVVRNGTLLDKNLEYNDALDKCLVAPVMQALVAPAATAAAAPYPPSPVIAGMTWASKETIVRKAKDNDTWPMTWADDDHLYTAYGNGEGFEPFVEQKLSLGVARVEGMPGAFQGINIRSAAMEFRGNGQAGKKASGMLCIGGKLYILVRNAGNAQLAWSGDHGHTWTWCDWKFTTSFGCPTFLNFGKDYAGARDDYVYVYSLDGATAYEPADRMVLGRVPKDRLIDRAAYQFFVKVDAQGQAMWSNDIARRGV